jgi:hypothetical protein
VVEHLLGKEEVGSSILLNSSKRCLAAFHFKIWSAVLPIAIGTAQQLKEMFSGLPV